MLEGKLTSDQLKMLLALVLEKSKENQDIRVIPALGSITQALIEFKPIEREAAVDKVPTATASDGEKGNGKEAVF
jgi:hypothetical protein